MGSVTRFAAAVGFAGAVAAMCAFPAEAGCKRMAFSVNDYGKDGPTKDSQDLLDKHIANWAAEQGIEKYTVGKKDVSCELFLNLIVVDEHTCTARATVCWGGDKLPATQEAKKKGVEKTAAKSEDAAGEAKPEEKSKEAKADKADKAAADAKPADTKPAESAPATAAAATTAPVETGALPLSNRTADNAPAPAADKSATDGYSVSDRDAVAAAAAAAERAAAAAERAAAAAERAAAAATEQAAAITAMKQSADNAAAATAAPAAAADSTSSSPPAYGAPAQPIVAPIQPETPKP